MVRRLAWAPQNHAAKHSGLAFAAGASGLLAGCSSSPAPTPAAPKAEVAKPTKLLNRRLPRSRLLRYRRNGNLPGSSLSSPPRASCPSLHCTWHAGRSFSKLEAIDLEPSDLNGGALTTAAVANGEANLMVPSSVPPSSPANADFFHRSCPGDVGRFSYRRPQGLHAAARAVTPQSPLNDRIKAL